MRAGNGRLMFVTWHLSGKSTSERAARVRACNSVNLKPGGIIELLLQIVNILRMCPRLGVAHSDQQWLDMATAEFARSALLSCLAKSA